MVQAQRIPGPAPKPILGNLTDVDAELGALSIARLIQRYGEIIQLEFLTRKRLFVGSQRLVHELCDQTRFEKKVVGALEEARNLAGDGLSFSFHSVRTYAERGFILQDSSRRINKNLHGRWRIGF